jgi:hypothetical protein
VEARSGHADTQDVSQILSDLTYFSRRVTEETARAKRTGGQFSVVLFRSQPSQDELPEIACVRGLPTITANVRDYDIVSRINRDTIAVLLIDTGDEGSRRAALRLLDRLGDSVNRWQVSFLDYPGRQHILEELGIAA